jgi:hypothetical protein
MDGIPLTWERGRDAIAIARCPHLLHPLLLSSSPPFSCLFLIFDGIFSLHFLLFPLVNII